MINKNEHQMELHFVSNNSRTLELTGTYNTVHRKYKFSSNGSLSYKVHQIRPPGQLRL
jgi:hypothetical protein